MISSKKIYSLHSNEDPSFPHVAGWIWEVGDSFQTVYEFDPSLDHLGSYGLTDMGIKSVNLASLRSYIRLIHPSFVWKTHISIPLHSDSGNSWYEVSKHVLSNLNILDRISNYSYQRDTLIFCTKHPDGSLLIKTLDKSKNYSYDVVEEPYTNFSDVRAFDAFNYIPEVPF